MKLLFIQIKGNSVGGIWFVNKEICEELTKRGEQVEVLSIRNNPGKNTIENNLNFKIKTINKTDLWEITHKKDVLKSLKEFKFLRTSYKYIKDNLKLKKDYKKVSLYIKNYNPDYIIASHYQVLDAIPKNYLSKTFYHHHNSLKEALNNKTFKKYLYKFNNKVNFLWLTKKTMEIAKNIGLHNNYFIYNPARFETKERAKVLENKKLIVVTRIENEQKRIDLMLELANLVLKEVADWTFEIYGVGEFTNFGKKILKENPRIKFLGQTNEPKSVLLNASINLNTSLFEGFSMSIIEASECGIPTVSFNFGESVNEQIINSKTGFIVNTKEEFIEKVLYLIKNQEALENMSINAKKYNEQFNIKNIGEKWESMLNKKGDL